MNEPVSVTLRLPVKILKNDEENKISEIIGTSELGPAVCWMPHDVLEFTVPGGGVTELGQDAGAINPPIPQTGFVPPEDNGGEDKPPA